MTILSERRRSVAFLEQEGETWACFLVTSRDLEGGWTGYFSFRPGDGETAEDEVRTADIFMEGSEGEILDKARNLGRPLLRGLLASALHTAARSEGRSSKLRRRFREFITENAQELQDETDLHSMYASYRLDQVAHFICLVDPPAFDEAVDRILEGRKVDFATRDRIQFALLVVEHIESHLPLPPFEVWARDFLDHPEEYRVYAHTLHREGRLP
ncbi:MAG: hypothetical protein ACE5GJ_12750 [Gemmatimonadota bacterium]